MATVTTEITEADGWTQIATDTEDFLVTVSGKCEIFFTDANAAPDDTTDIGHPMNVFSPMIRGGINGYAWIRRRYDSSSVEAKVSKGTIA